MPFRLRQIPSDDKLSHHFLLHAFHDCYPPEVVGLVLSDCHAWEERERALGMMSIMYLLMAFNLFPRSNTVEVLRHMSRGPLYVWPQEVDEKIPTAGAISSRRRQLQVVPVRRLFGRCCQPMATPQTPGAFALGRRVMAIDGTLQDVTDVPENAVHFGRLTNGPSQSPFPQMRAVYLAECGTHAIVDAALAPCRYNEKTMVWGLLRSIQPDMLVTMDRGFFNSVLVAAFVAKGADVIMRLQSNMLIQKPGPQDWLPDGSYLYTVTSKMVRGLKKPLKLRIIPYHIVDPEVPHFLEKQRLVTTLLDHREVSAQELVDLYHERWEVELALDEQKVHQRISQNPLRSRTAANCYQEMYGLLLAHYAIRHLMHQAAVQEGIDPDRLSFTHALHVVQHSLQDFGQTDSQDHPALKKRLLCELLEERLPPRKLRFLPRVVKRPNSSFHRKTWWYPDVHLKGMSVTEIFLI